MATLYSHTFEDLTGVNTLPGTFYLSGLVTGGATHATISSITTMFYVSTNGDYVMRCRIKDSEGNWGDYSYEDVTWAGETTQIITFTFADVTAQVSSNRFEVQVSKSSGPPFTTYLAHDDDDSYFVVEGVWEGVSPGAPTTPTPTNNDTEVDFSGFALSWVTGGNTDTYDVWIGPSGSLSRVSQEQEGTSYVTNISEVPLNQKIYWRVDAIRGEETTEGTNWNFDARPGQVSTTVPIDEASDITLHSTTGSWDSPSANTTSYRVLYGTLSGFLEEVGTTSDLSIALVEGQFPIYGKISYWRVNAVNDFGTTVGEELYFTTMLFDPVLPTGVTLDHSGGEGGVPTGTATGENNMMTVRRLVVAAYNKIYYENI